MAILDGRVFIVSGVGPGLGRSVGATALEEGASLVLGDIDASRLSGIRQALDSSGTRSVAIEADIAAEPTGEALVAAAVDRFGRLDGIVHVAAIDYIVGGLLDGDLDDWTRAADINVKGTLRLTKAAVPALSQSGSGSVVIIGSIAAREPTEGIVQLAYGCSKSALETAGYYLSRELGPRGIRVNTVAPGWKWGPTLEIGMQAQADQLGVPIESLLAPVRDTISLGRFADDQDVANAVVFLLSDRARAITGQTIFVDGGICH
jgi:NAD(P)-dependent dehydrogenase (short-subunit alcohol dehydrogenase family)